MKMRILNKIKNRMRWLISFPISWYYKLFYPMPRIKSIEETIKEMIEKKCSVSRYGDGELDIMAGRSIPFQTYNVELAEKMQYILHVEDKNFLVCLPIAFDRSCNLTPKAKKYWKDNIRKNIKTWHRLLKKRKIYYNTSMTRPYIDFLDKNNAREIFKLIKKLWDNRDVLFVEGEKSRLGVGNDLFDNAKSIRRILCPTNNAFSYYEEIINCVKRFEKETLVLIALGPTATIMAYELYKEGYQACDIGHIDIEYEWFLMGATSKVAIHDKYTNEAINGTSVSKIINDKKYQSEIVAQIGV